MGKRIYFIDKENIGNRFLKGLEDLKPTDMVILFHYEPEGSHYPIKANVLEALSKTKAAVEIHKLRVHTKNAMDFQICTYLGFMFHRYGIQAEYRIVSEDRGYLAAVDFLKQELDNRIDIKLVENCIRTENVPQYGKLDILLSPVISKKMINQIRQAIKQYPDLSSFHNFLQKKYQKDYNHIYNLLKPQYQQIRESI